MEALEALPLPVEEATLEAVHERALGKALKAFDSESFGVAGSADLNVSAPPEPPGFCRIHCWYSSRNAMIRTSHSKGRLKQRTLRATQFTGLLRSSFWKTLAHSCCHSRAETADCKVEGHE